MTTLDDRATAADRTATDDSATADLLASLVTPEHVHRRLYTDPSVFSREMTHVFGGTWCYVGHESQVPGPGDYLRASLGARPVLLTRDRDGALHVILNRCSHRGTMLVTDEYGRADTFTCPYHGWRFGSDGCLRNVPVPSSYADVRSGRFDIGTALVAVHRGFVFATLARDPVPFDEWLGPVGPWIDLLVDRHPRGRVAVHRDAVRYEYRANWKMSWDNAADGIHATFAHRSYNLLGRTADTETVLARNPAATPLVSRAYPYGHAVVDQRPAIPDGAWASMRPMPTGDQLVASLAQRGLDDPATLDLATGSMINVSLFPNLLFVGNQIMVVEPVAVDRTRLSVYLLAAPGAPEEVDLLRLRVDEDFVSFGTPDDCEMFERVQAGLAIPEAEWIDTSRGAALDTDDPEITGAVVGDVATEAPIRGYLREWTRLMTCDRPTVQRVRGVR